MSTGPTPTLQDLHEVLFAHVGKNLLLYQNLEWTLKGLLPLVDLQGAASSLEKLPARQKQLKRMTLGPLAQRLLAVCRGSDPEFVRLVKKVGKDRNDLAHHYFRGHQVIFADRGSCQNAIDKLIEKRLELRLVTGALHNMLIAHLHVITEVTFADTPEYGQMRQMVDQMNAQLRGGADLDWIHEMSWEEDGETKSTGPLQVGLKNRQ